MWVCGCVGVYVWVCGFVCMCVCACGCVVFVGAGGCVWVCLCVVCLCVGVSMCGGVYVWWCLCVCCVLRTFSKFPVISQRMLIAALDAIALGVLSADWRLTLKQLHVVLTI